MADLTLYYIPTCSFCAKVLHFMKENNIDITSRNRDASSENREALLDAGGKTQVPCLLIDGKALYESDAIIEWLQNHVLKESEK